MVYFQTKKPNLGNFWRVSRWKMLVYFIDIWYIFQPFGILYGDLVYFLVIWYIFPRFGMLFQQKSGNTVPFCYLIQKVNFFNNHYLSLLVGDDSLSSTAFVC
jgi:hypothetical protein